MDILFTPWRYRWVTAQNKPGGCLFCKVLAEHRDGPSNWILFRGQHNFVILNRFPYNSGHIMVVPKHHIDSIAAMSGPQMLEMMELARRCETVLRQLYRPDGLNLGMNLGRSSGAGIEGHLHLHMVPRWSGDTNFMAAINDTRILPESLTSAYRKIRRALRESEPDPARTRSTSASRNALKPATGRSRKAR
jgi:ATP adenylyltransferase